MAYIELDHTSSGVQIAAALTRNLATAKATNIAGEKDPADLYTLIVDDTNAALDAMKFPKERMIRKDVKTAAIAMVYGGGLSNNVMKAVFAKYGSVEMDAVEALEDAIKKHMGAVMVIQKHLDKIVRAVGKSGEERITINLHNGTKFTEIIGAYRKEGDFFPQIQEDHEEYKARCRGVKYLVSEDQKDMGQTARSVTAAMIQGLDATILSRTQVELTKRGIPFFSKHDAYLIDDSHRDALTEIVQDVFFEVFSNDILKETIDSLKAAYPAAAIPDFDQYGEYDIELVKKSKHLISE